MKTKKYYEKGSKRLVTVSDHRRMIINIFAEGNNDKQKTCLVKKETVGKEKSETKQ